MSRDDIRWSTATAYAERLIYVGAAALIVWLLVWRGDTP